MKVEIVNPPALVKPVGYAHMSRVTSPAGTMLLLGVKELVDDGAKIEIECEALLP